MSDEYTLRKLGVDEAKLIVHAIAVAGLALAIGVAAPEIVLTVVGKLSVLAVSNLAVWVTDKTTDFERKLVKKILEIPE